MSANLGERHCWGRVGWTSTTCGPKGSCEFVRRAFKDLTPFERPGGQKGCLQLGLWWGKCLGDERSKEVWNFGD